MNVQAKTMLKQSHPHASGKWNECGRSGGNVMAIHTFKNLSRNRQFHLNFVKNFNRKLIFFGDVLNSMTWFSFINTLPFGVFMYNHKNDVLIMMIRSFSAFTQQLWNPFFLLCTIVNDWRWTLTLTPPLTIK